MVSVSFPPGVELSIVEVEGIHEAIITDDLWQQVREKRKACSVLNERVDEPDRVSLLSGLIRCPACGKGLITSKNKRCANFLVSMVEKYGKAVLEEIETEEQVIKE